LRLRQQGATILQALSSSTNGIAGARPVIVRTRPQAAVIDTLVEAKLKTRKAAAKRYKITGSGKVMCRRAGKQHLNEKMSRKQNTRLSNEKAVFAGDVCFPLKHHLLARNELSVLLW
jgi:ribosomal protein L35